MRLWRRRERLDAPPPSPPSAEAADLLARRKAAEPEVGRLARALHRILEDNHLSPRIARLYARDD